jgi:hypothetical protein
MGRNGIAPNRGPERPCPCAKALSRQRTKGPLGITHGRASYGFALTKYEKSRRTTFSARTGPSAKPEMDAGPDMLVAIAEDENCQEVICLRGGGV